MTSNHQTNIIIKCIFNQTKCMDCKLRPAIIYQRNGFYKIIPLNSAHTTKIIISKQKELFRLQIANSLPGCQHYIDSESAESRNIVGPRKTDFLKLI